MRIPKPIRVLFLLLLLLPLVILAFWEQDPRPSWQRTLIVGVYPHNGDGSAEAQAWLDQIRPEHFRPIEDFLAAEAARYGLGLDRPFEFRLGYPIASAPPPPPAGNGATRERLTWGIRLRWWHLRLYRQGLKPDIVLIATYQTRPAGFFDLQSIGMASPRLGLTQLIAGENFREFNRVVVAHELLHTVGANDLYGRDGRPQYPQGYADPGRIPIYPQQRAELMAMQIPLSPELARPPRHLGETQIGPTTAREIGWAPAP